MSDQPVSYAAHLGNRRLGHRVQPESLEVLWCVPGSVVGHKRESKRPPTARVVDLSFTGMQVLAPVHKKVTAGSVLGIVMEGSSSPVRVRWIREAKEPGQALFGVEFVGQTPRFMETVNRLIVECSLREGIELREPPLGRRTVW
jgi:hypothetical protein